MPILCVRLCSSAQNPAERLTEPRITDLESSDIPDMFKEHQGGQSVLKGTHRRHWWSWEWGYWEKIM